MADYELEPVYLPEPETEYPPCDGGSYRTGSTTPPKDHAGAVSVVLILVILFCVLSSALNLLDIRLFSGLQAVVRTHPVTSVSSGEVTPGLEATQPTALPTDPTLPTAGEEIEIHDSRPSGENIPEEGALSWQQVYERVIPSVVSVLCSGRSSQSSGTGVIMSESGYVITNAHVIEGAVQIAVLLSDGRSFQADVMGSDTVSDLAVLHIEAEGLVPAQFGDSSVLRVGDAVVAIGDPLGVELRGTMTDGIISAINRDLDLGTRTMSLIQTSAALNSGNSGGPLVNCYGQVVGINAVKIGDYAASGGVEGLGFAIPMATVKDVVDQIVSYGYVTGRPTLGIRGEMVSQFYQFYYGLPSGLLITMVEPGSDSAAQGLRSGDILLQIAGQRITDAETVDRVVNGCTVGQVIEVVVYRGGTEYLVSLTVTEDTPD